MPSTLEFHRIDHGTLIYKNILLPLIREIWWYQITFLNVSRKVSISNSDTCLHGGCCSDFHLVGTGHYMDGFNGICLYSGEWLSMHTLVRYWDTLTTLHICLESVQVRALLSICHTKSSNRLCYSRVEHYVLRALLQ